MNENNDHRLKWLKILRKRSPNEMKELLFLLSLNEEYISSNASVIEIGMVIIREAEKNNALDKLDQAMKDMGISETEIDVELRSSNLKNDTSKPFDLSLPSSIDVNDLSKFINAHEPEGLRGICLGNFVGLLKEQDFRLVACFLYKLIRFLDIDQQKYLQLIDTLMLIKPDI